MRENTDLAFAFENPPTIVPRRGTGLPPTDRQIALLTDLDYLPHNPRPLSRTEATKLIYQLISKWSRT